MAEELHLAPAVRAKAVNVVDDRAAPRAARRKCEVERPARGSAERGHRFLSLGIGQRTSAGVAELFDMALRGKRRDRAARSGPDFFLLERAFDDCLERMQSLGRRFDRALLIGCPDGSWPRRLAQLCERIDLRDQGQIYATKAGGEIIVEDAWLPPEAEYDLVLAIGTFDTVNQLPLALRLVRHSMRGESLFIGALSGGETLPQLRAAMRAADAVTGAAAPHVHPRIEPSALAPLLKSDAGKLFRETLVSWIFLFAGCECGLRFRPSLEPGEGQAAIIILIRRLRSALVGRLQDAAPLALIQKLLQLGSAAADVLRAGRKRQRQQKQENGQPYYYQRAGSGSASRVQLCIGRHRVSKSLRSIFKSFRCAGSFTRITRSWLSSPTTTT